MPDVVSPERIAEIRARLADGLITDVRAVGDLLLALDAATAERDEARTLAAIGTWHRECRPNREMAARELQKSQAVIDKLAADLSALRARTRELEKLAREATNGWAVFAKRKAELDDIGRLHREIDRVAAPSDAASRPEQTE